MSFLGRCLVVVLTTGLLFVAVGSTQADGDTCMSRWLILSDISNKSVPSYEARLKSLMLDESNYHHPRQRQVVPFLLHRHPKDENRFLQCIGKHSIKCRRHAPCSVGGKCLLNKTTGYNCKCRTAYTGPFCQEDMDECADGLHACNRNATCTNNHGNYTCSCKLGFTGDGRRCKEIDKCSPNPCKNGGQCQDHVNHYSCHCAVGYDGINCSTRWLKTDLHKHVPGRLRSITRAVRRLFGKIANVGKTLKALSKDYCKPNPCKNGGTCFNHINGASCSCLLMMFGRWCEQDLLRLQRCYQIGGFLYKGVCLKKSTVNNSYGHNDSIPGGCTPYQPSVGWRFNDYNVICEHFGGSSSLNCDNVDKDAEGGRCSNYQAVLSYEVNSGPDVWVNSRTFGPGWKPTRTSSPDCRLVTHHGLMVIVYACQL